MNVTSEYFSDKKANANKQFNHFTGVDENCQAFNNKNMWDLDQANSFSGFKKGSNGSGFNNTCGNSFSGNKTIDQTLNAAGTSDGVCGDGVNVCPSGEMCVDGRCQPARRGRLNSQVNRKSRRTSQDRISVNPVRGNAPNTMGKQSLDCTPPSVECVLNGYRDCYPSHKCNGGAMAAQMKNVSGRTSRRGSADRISNKPVMGTAIKSSFSAAEKVFPYGTGNNFGGEASARCGLDR